MIRLNPSIGCKMIAHSISNLKIIPWRIWPMNTSADAYLTRVI